MRLRQIVPILLMTIYDFANFNTTQTVHQYKSTMELHLIWTSFVNSPIRMLKIYIVKRYSANSWFCHKNSVPAQRFPSQVISHIDEIQENHFHSLPIFSSKSIPFNLLGLRPCRMRIKRTYSILYTRCFHRSCLLHSHQSNRKIILVFAPPWPTDSPLMSGIDK